MKEGELQLVETKLRKMLSETSSKMAEKTSHTQPYGLEKLDDNELLYHYVKLTTEDKSLLFREKGIDYLRFADRMEELRTKRGV